MPDLVSCNTVVRFGLEGRGFLVLKGDRILLGTIQTVLIKSHEPPSRVWGWRGLGPDDRTLGFSRTQTLDWISKSPNPQTLILELKQDPRPASPPEASR